MFFFTVLPSDNYVEKKFTHHENGGAPLKLVLQVNAQSIDLRIFQHMFFLWKSI